MIFFYENIGYEDLLTAHPYDWELIKGIGSVSKETQNILCLKRDRRPALEVLACYYLAIWNLIYFANTRYFDIKNA